MSKQTNIGRNTAVDFQEGLVLVRSITGTNSTDNSTDAAVTLDPGALDAAAFNAIFFPTGQINDFDDTGKFPVNGARTIKMRVWSTSNTGSVRIALKEFPHDGPRLKGQAGLQTKGKGTLVLDATFVTSGSSTVNSNPVTGVAGASTFHEAGSITVNYSQASRVNQYPSANTTNELFVTVDTLGAKVLYPQLVSSVAGASATILVGMQRID